MGQQQLLLLVLSIVIVGSAVVAGIEAFSENQRKSTTDGMVSDIVRLASDAQAWSLKPTAFGGPADAQGFLDLTLGDLGYAVDAESGLYQTETAVYLLTPVASDCLIIQSADRASFESGAFGTAVRVDASVAGPQPDDILVETDGTTPSCE